MDELIQFLLGVLSAEDLATALELIGDMTPGTSLASDSRNTKVSTVIDRATIKELQSIRAAEEAVEPYVGAVLGLDSEYAVYAEAIKRMGCSSNGLARSASAAKAVFAMARDRGARPRVAMDSVSDAKYREKFPGVAALKVR